MASAGSLILFLRYFSLTATERVPQAFRRSAWNGNRFRTEIKYEYLDYLNIASSSFNSPSHFPMLRQREIRPRYYRGESPILRNLLTYHLSALKLPASFCRYTHSLLAGMDKLGKSSFLFHFSSPTVKWRIFGLDCGLYSPSLSSSCKMPILPCSAAPHL